ncbi:hypothetical protein AVEN_71856-1 [Araneus ventricosus]|uniref:Uncharacterized protein n=1 Tax=Araneus ventricosus TaxID=182803 RepID=A0A4Y2J489_ARAVE|nr:hypothetical protein AVEN_102792-1 [Araneus ventricosus]GBM84797.1 hypothetical protein AVEN_235967-1 [Araneus ventricosus]GBM84809.1 hypothetical protein AVEN_242073-1 [Araneus ventricosus]GBM84927.1 hypothetical protein AVEN_71856-1 [Araneus ventricosus]
MFSVAIKLSKTFVAPFASAIEGPGSSCSSSISEDESTVELFLFHLLMPRRYLPHSLPQLTRKSPLPWLTPGQVSTGERRGDRNCKEPCLLFLCPTYGVNRVSNKGTIGEEYGLCTRVFHAKGVTLVEAGLT